MTKSIGYAYPTSTTAERFKKPHGCYYVEIEKHGKQTIPQASFNTVEEAEAHADTLDCPWSEQYKRWPLRGSRFDDDND